MKKVGIGLIGCGRISSQHLDSVKLYRDRAEVVAVCDIIPHRAKETAKKYRISDWYKDYHEMLRQPEIDLVSVCTPNGHHKRMAIDIARSGKHALVEKPLALNVVDIRVMQQAFKKMRKHLFVVLQVRHNPPVVFLKKYLAEGNLGTVKYATLTIRWYRPPEYFKDTWRGTKKLDGGSLLNQGIHYIDAMQWILGSVDMVYSAKTLNLCHNIEIEDTVFATLKLLNGTWVNIEFTLCAYPQNSECSLTIVGEKGTVKVGGKALDELAQWMVPGRRAPKLASSIQPNRYAGGLYQGSCPYHFLVYRDVLDVLQRGKPNPISEVEAFSSIQTIEAIYKSARMGKVVVIHRDG
jgi:UDP-N-acetyl-2-amino-2-deoxyglucuronate dehydrogenase